MRKAGTVAPVLEIVVNTAETITTRLATLSTAGKSFIGLVDSTIATRQRERNEMTERRNDYKLKAHNYANDWGNAYVQLKGLPELTVTPETISKAEMLARQFARHVFIDSVTVTTEEIIVYTKLLFSDIRTGDGERTTERRCIGAYKIAIATRDINHGRYSRRAHYRNGVRITNMLYVKSLNPHWAVSTDTIPCGGEYNEQFSQLWDDKDWYNFIDTYIQFLRFSGDDGAYTRSHRWIDSRLAYLPQLTGVGRVREKASIVVTREYRGRRGYERDDNGEYIYDTVPAGGKYRVLYSSNGCPTIEYEGRHVSIAHSYFAVIKYSLFKKVANLNDIEQTYLKPLDVLPDGSTLTQALELLKI